MKNLLIVLCVLGMVGICSADDFNTTLYFYGENGEIQAEIQPEDFKSMSDEEVIKIGALIAIARIDFDSAITPELAKRFIPKRFWKKEMDNNLGR